MCLDVERAYRLYLVAEEVDAKRLFRAVTVDVEDRAAHGEVSRGIHIVYFLKTVCSKPFCRFGEVGGASRGEMQRMGVDGVARCYFLGECFGIGHHITQRAVGVPAVQYLRAHYLRRRVGLSVFDGSLVT